MLGEEIMCPDTRRGRSDARQRCARRQEAALLWWPSQRKRSGEATFQPIAWRR